VQASVVDVLVAKALAAVEQTGLQELVVAGGVGANSRLRAQLSKQAERRGYTVRYPELQFCTDNGAMIAFAGALRLQQAPDLANGFTVRARWELEELAPVGQARE
jgi:N6-L-threonylcarbamoyladenine synthase